MIGKKYGHLTLVHSVDKTMDEELIEAVDGFFGPTGKVSGEWRSADVADLFDDPLSPEEYGDE